ncbi:MAG: hypothetical protein AAFZ17_14505, partial [Cyanobacteria bacterium J06650_10]
ENKIRQIGNLAYFIFLAYQFGVYKCLPIWRILFSWPTNLAYINAYQFGVFLLYQFGVLRFSTA